MLALEWLKNAHGIMEKLEATQLENIKKAATVMADAIEAGRWVHTFGCGHATIPVEEMYPRHRQFRRLPPALRTPFDVLYANHRSDGYPPVPFLGKSRGLRTGNHEEL